MTTIERNTIGEGMFEGNGVLLIHIVIPPASLDLLRWLSTIPSHMVIFTCWRTIQVGDALFRAVIGLKTTTLIPLRIIDCCDSSMASTRWAPYNLYKWSYNLRHPYGWPKINGVAGFFFTPATDGNDGLPTLNGCKTFHNCILVFLHQRYTLMPASARNLLASNLFV